MALPVTVDAMNYYTPYATPGTLRSYLLSQRPDVDQLAMVTMAADPTPAHATWWRCAGVGPEKSPSCRRSNRWPLRDIRRRAHLRR